MKTVKDVLLDNKMAVSAEEARSWINQGFVRVDGVVVKDEMFDTSDANEIVVGKRHKIDLFDLYGEGENDTYANILTGGSRSEGPDRALSAFDSSFPAGYFDKLFR